MEQSESDEYFDFQQFSFKATVQAILDVIVQLKKVSTHTEYHSKYLPDCNSRTVIQSASASPLQKR